MPDSSRTSFAWMDALWLVFLSGLAVLPPVLDIHKHLTLLAIGLFQLFEGRILKPLPPSRRSFYSVLIKVLLATLLVGHTGGISSSYYLIYFLPVVSAAMLYGAWGTLLWTAIALAAYCSYLVPALREFELTASGASELALRFFFFYLAAIVVNRFVTESRHQALLYQKLAETLAETNQRLAAAQEDARRSERLAALGQMSAGLAHEIRNPLGVIKGSAEMLSKRLGQADALAAELAGYISGETNRLNSLVARFLDFAHPLEIKAEPQPIAPIVAKALQNVQDQYAKSAVDVEQHYAPNLPLPLVDGELCEGVFTNLFLNAYEAMGDAGGRLKISAAPAEDDGKSGVEVTVQDSGPGIPAELREQIFNPFMTTKKEGVGLGLAIVSKVVDDHRGSIRVTSEPGYGACFRVFLPAETQG